MIVISKVANKKLLKGHRYEVQNLWNAGNNQRWVEGKVQLVGFSSRYSVDSFTDSSGNALPNSNYVSTLQQVERFIKFEDCKEGEIVVCNSDHYKTLAKGSMYKIEKLEKTETEKNGWGRSWTHKETTIKFEGIKRKLKFNGWAFRKLTPEETREISLGLILSGEEPDIVKTTDIRKIDMVVNKERALMEVIAKTIIDENRHHLSIIDWGCQKTGEKMRIKPEDFKDLLDMKLSDILEKIEK